MPFYITYEAGRPRRRMVLRTFYYTREEALQAAQEAVQPVGGEIGELPYVVGENVEIVEADTWVDAEAQVSPEAAALFARFPQLREARLNPRPRLPDRVLRMDVSALHGGVELALHSLEMYAARFVVRTRLLIPQERAPTPESFWLADLVLQASDDRGAQYRAGPTDGGGDGRQWGFAHTFTPAPDPAARVLRLEASELSWRRWVEGQVQQAEVQRGRWTFEVSLQGEEHAEP
jgi:hypothetical protein